MLSYDLQKEILIDIHRYRMRLSDLPAKYSDRIPSSAFPDAFGQLMSDELVTSDDDPDHARLTAKGKHFLASSSEEQWLKSSRGYEYYADEDEWIQIYDESDIEEMESMEQEEADEIPASRKSFGDYILWAIGVHIVIVVFVAILRGDYEETPTTTRIVPYGDYKHVIDSLRTNMDTSFPGPMH